MLIIGVQNTKGGATKSTTSVNLARAYQKRGLKVAIGETDSQRTLEEWANDNDDPDNDLPKVIQMPSREYIVGSRNNPELEGIEILIIDGVANGFKEFMNVTAVADLVVIVTQPSPADIKPINDLMDSLSGGNKKAVFLITRTRTNDDMVDLVRDALSEFQLPVLRNTIRDLKGFRTTFGSGQTVFEYSAYKHAQDDVDAVAMELWEEHLNT